MRFRKYSIHFVETVDGVSSFKSLGNIDQRKFFKRLNTLPKMSDENQEFAFISVKESEGFVAGILAQSYGLVITRFKDEEGSKEEVEIDLDKANEKTLMYFDIAERTVSIQNKRYSASTLNPSVTVIRVEKLLSKVFKKVINLQPEKINYSMEEINDIFQSSFVSKVIYKNLKGLKIEEGTKLHNPRAELDDSLRETWNAYSSKDISRMDIYGEDGKNLNKDPLAKIGIHLATVNNNIGEDNKPIINKITINDAGGSIEDIKPSGNEYRVIPISKYDQESQERLLDKTLFWAEKSNVRRLIPKSDDNK
jgi:hypothetical protein